MLSKLSKLVSSSWSRKMLEEEKYMPATETENIRSWLIGELSWVEIIDDFSTGIPALGSWPEARSRSRVLQGQSRAGFPSVQNRLQISKSPPKLKYLEPAEPRFHVL